MKKVLKNYFNELTNVDLANFNKFIFSNIFAKSLKFNTIVPVLAAMSVIAFSVALQTKFYIFIPQTSITAFASYVIFASVTSLLILILYPFTIIILLNYIGHRVPAQLKKIFFPIKVIILIVIFYFCISVMASSMILSHKIYITCLWVLLYFILINVYINYTNHNSLRAFGRYQIIFALVFGFLAIRPFFILFIYTSEMINYTSINSKIYLPQTSCNLLTTPIGNKDLRKNMTVNDPEYYKATNDGCYILGNSIRYGFGGDSVLIFKKNIQPITNSQNQQYNAYVRLTCYSSNCYAQDDLYTLNDKDNQSSLILSDQEKKINRRKNLD